MVVGPSGAGKDTLIAGVRAALAGNPQFAFPRRVITRPSNAFEEHDSLDDEGFERASSSGAFAFTWEAHGLKYGIPVAIDDDLHAGRTVVCNVSRTIIKSLYARYEHSIVVLVTAPANIISARLAARERSSDGDLNLRMRREHGVETLSRPDFVIQNVGTAELGIRELQHIISAPRVPSNFAAEMLF